MSSTSQTSSGWSVGSTSAPSAAFAVPPALPATSASQGAVQPRGDRDSVLRHVSADPYLTSHGPLSADELRWQTMCACNGAIPPNPSPAPLPEWITRVVAPVSGAEALTSRVANRPAGASPPAAQPAAPAAPAPVAISPTGEALRHPDPSTSLEELRWRDYQILRSGGTPPAIGPAPAAQAAPQQAAAASGAAAPVFALNAATGAAAPNTPQFPTPVRTLFPPTPPPGGGLGFGAAPGLLGLGGPLDAGDMDTAPSVDLESQFHSMYVRPENAVASPEEMRVVQVESYRTGRQIAPYWLVGGAS